MEQFGNKRTYFKYIVITILILLTIFRIYLGVNIPLFLQGNARYDDYLMIKYTDSILSGDWLGIYGNLTLAKTCAMSVLVAFGYITGISYSTMLTYLYVLSVLAVSVAVGKLLNNKPLIAIMYSYLLFSPIMFHKENVQKVYRGGYIVIFALFVVASIIGMFAFSKSKITHITIWAVMGTLTFPVFWYLKEDSIWLLPFIIVGTAITMICVKVENKENGIMKAIICSLPVLVLILCILVYKGTNYKIYGIYTDTDRDNTYFAEVIHDLLKMEGASNGDSWLTRDALIQAMENSETFMSIWGQVVSVYDARAEKDGNVSGDFFIWGLREGAGMAGVYDNGADFSEQFWKNVHNELTESYENGLLLEEKNQIFLSHVTRGATIEEFKEYYWQNFRDTLSIILFYELNELEVISSDGEDYKINLMAKFVGDNYISEKTPVDKIKRYENTVNIAKHITGLYSESARLIFIVAFAGYVIYCVGYIFNWRKEKNNIFYDWKVLIVCLGLACTTLILIMAVLWFCNFLTVYKIYDYCSAAIPMIEVLEIVGCYFFFSILYRQVRIAFSKRHS